MNVLSQLIAFLSESPGSVIYHLATLFALQIVFALSLAQRRRALAAERDDEAAEAGRMTWAAGLIFLARLLLLAVGALVAVRPETAVSILPPLTQAVHAYTAVFLVWALAPHSKRLPQLGNVFLSVALILTSVMYIYFAQAWARQTDGGAYNGSPQATAWVIWQLIVLASGVVAIAASAAQRFSLRMAIILIVLTATVVLLWDGVTAVDSTVAASTTLLYWLRLGYLVAFPLWAVLVQRNTTIPIVAAQERPAEYQLAQALNLSRYVIRRPEEEATAQNAVSLVKRLVDADFVGVAALLDRGGEENELRLTSNQPQASLNRPRSWSLNVSDWPAFRQALTERQSIVLSPEGLGARQLHQWYQEMGMPALGSLLITPLHTDETAVGLLLLAGKSGGGDWSDDDKLFAKAAANYTAQALVNARLYEQLLEAPPMAVASEENTAVSGQLIALEKERDDLQATLSAVESRLQQTEARLTESGKRAQTLAATLALIENRGDSDESRERIAELEAETESLREALIEAEEAMALAAASETELSAEWVMMAITRYSGQLEEAQMRIRALEGELAEWEHGALNRATGALAQELRMPMTSIVGYTDLLLGEGMKASDDQRELLERIRTNGERMQELLTQLVEATDEQDAPTKLTQGLADVRAMTEMAVGGVVSHIREKRLRLDMNFDPDLPLLPGNYRILSDVIGSLLDNACQVSEPNGRVAVNAQMNQIMDHVGVNGSRKSVALNYLHLEVSDSGGGIAPKDIPDVFNAQQRASASPIAGLGDAVDGLALARTLVESQGGRIWVESEMGKGSTFSALLPLANGDAD